MERHERIDIYNPTIEQCKRGWMCTIKPEAPDGQGGCIIEEVLETLVKVRCYIGGTEEHSEWVDFTYIQCTWSVGNTYEELYVLIGDLHAEFLGLPKDINN